jgi:hypothetical protein
MQCRVLLIHTTDMRLCELDAQLEHRVEFGYGILGELSDKTHIFVARAEVSPAQWTTTKIRVHLDGSILLLKSISRDVDSSRYGFKVIAHDLSVAEAAAILAARWDLMQTDKYMWASVQTIRGCPKHCSFCSVWRTDGQEPRQRTFEKVIDEIIVLRRMGFRFIALADDNFYPVTLTDLRLAREQNNVDKLESLTNIRKERFLLMAELAKLPKDMVFFTQITMESAEDAHYLDAMRQANIKGALVGVESVTPEGLKAVYKNFNYSGDRLVEQLQAFRTHGVHVLGSFIFGLPTDNPSTFGATVELALKAGVTFAQFVMLTPFPGTVDFGRWEKEQAKSPVMVEGTPITRYWLIPTAIRPKMFTPHPLMSADEIRERTQKVWDRFYNISAIWKRSSCTSTLRARVAFLLLSKLYRQMYAGTGISTDSARRRKAKTWARWIAHQTRKMFRAEPMPELMSPVWEPRVKTRSDLTQLTVQVRGVLGSD